MLADIHVFCGKYICLDFFFPFCRNGWEHIFQCACPSFDCFVHRNYSIPIDKFLQIRHLADHPAIRYMATAGGFCHSFTGCCATVFCKLFSIPFHGFRNSFFYKIGFPCRNFPDNFPKMRGKHAVPAYIWFHGDAQFIPKSHFAYCRRNPFPIQSIGRHNGFLLD